MNDMQYDEYSTILSLGVLISAVSAIIFRQQNNIKLYAVFKPLTTILILLTAIIIYLNFRSSYTAVVIASLVFCLIGDIFLIGDKFFVYGLSSFLIAHVGFTIAFSELFGFCLKTIPLIILVLSSGLYFSYLRKDLDKYTIPVIIYSTAIVIMTWQAVGLVYTDRSLQSYGVAAGSVLFLFSDSVLAFKKFKKPFRIAEVLILSTYWTAIYVFTISGIYFGVKQNLLH